MLSTLALFTDIISSFEIVVQEVRSDLSKTKIRLTLTKGLIVFLREIIIENVLFDYSYHWQNADGTLITRWDNAAHHSHIETHPHHKHVVVETNIQTIT